MPLLTDKAFAAVLNLNDLIHIVDVSDVTGSPFGTSKKITLTQLKSIVDSDAQTLSNVLALGATTADGQTINALNGGGQLNLRRGGNNTVELTTDAGVYGESWIYSTPTYNEFGMNGNYIEVNETSIFSKLGGFAVVASYDNTLGATPTPIATDYFPTLLSSETSSVNAVIYNSVVLGGKNITAKTANTAYLNQIGFNSGAAFETVLNHTTATADNSVTLRDQSGSVALINTPTIMTPVGTTQTVDFKLGTAQTIDLASATGNVTLTLSNPTAGDTYIIKVIQDVVAPIDLVYPASVKWAGGTAPVITVGATGVDTIVLFWDGTNYYASINQNFS